jgi:hypothetical protein
MAAVEAATEGSVVVVVVGVLDDPQAPRAMAKIATMRVLAALLAKQLVSTRGV